jgi:hypothetical protein
VSNPFADEAAVRAAAEVLKQLEWKRQQELWEAHLKACEAIIRHGVLPRLELAASAVREWSNEAEVTGVARTETYAGTTHFRAKITINSGTREASYLEFIASPKSMVIAAEAACVHEKKCWKKNSSNRRRNIGALRQNYQ